MKYLAATLSITAYIGIYWTALNPEKLFAAEQAATAGAIAGAIWWIITLIGGILIIRSDR